MKTITTISAAIDLMDKIEKLTDETGVTVELRFQNVPLSEMEILAKQENLKINFNGVFEVKTMKFFRGDNKFYFITKFIL